MSVLDGASVLFTIDYGAEDPIKFDSIVFWGLVYKIDKDSDWFEAVNTIALSRFDLTFMETVI